ncbi:MAG: sulfotransferase domain-containing protein [Candidatus Paceibacterota bacterium]
MNNHPLKPTFFILGAPKCGTTALSEYLRTHADVFISEPKEAEYYTAYARTRGAYHAREEYIAHVFSGAEGHAAIGGAPTRLLRTPEAIPNILEHNPDTRFIVMLRNPVEMFESLYWQRVYEGAENAATPEKAWEIHTQIDTGRPRTENDPENGELRYGEICRLGEQLERVYKQARKDRVLVLFYDDLKNDARSVYQQTLSFLNVPDDDRNDFPVIHRRKSTRSPLARRLIKKAGRLKKALGVRRSLRDFPLVQRIVGGTKPLSNELRHELTRYFRSDRVKLEKLTGRDLSNWKQL